MVLYYYNKKNITIKEFLYMYTKQLETSSKKKKKRTTTQLGRPQPSSNYFMWPSKAMTKWWMRQRKINADGSLSYWPSLYLPYSASVWVQVKKINKWHSWLLSAWFEEDIGLFWNWRILACSLQRNGGV